MTCIVGIAVGGRVHIGGDSAGVAGLDLRIRRDEKVFTNGAFAFGCTTSFRMIQLLRYSLQPPLRHPDTDIARFMATTFIDAVRATLKAGGFAKVENAVEQGGSFLVGHAGQLFQVMSDYQVQHAADGFDACGCGESYALASMYASRQSKSSAQERITKALECAAHFSAGVRAPFSLVEVNT